MGHVGTALGNGELFIGTLPQVALTKTVPPSIGSSVVERRKLLAALRNASSRRLTILRAPAGYGKTTLMADWCRRLRAAGSVAAWLSLDGDDNEPGSFAYHVTRAIATTAPELTRDAVELLETSNLIPARNIVSSLINAVSETDAEVYLIFDDYHVISDPRCCDLVSFILRYAPSNLHTVLLTRTEPRLQISRLRLADDVVEIDAAGLCFDLPETERFLGPELASRLGGPGVARVYAATEGWPAALQLARISLRNADDPEAQINAFSGRSRSISAYLDETLSSEPEHIVTFLLKTSILGQMNGELCDAVTGMTQSAALLETLAEKQFLVVSLEGAGGWYRYHRLLSEFLAERHQSRLGDRLPELHRRAYLWYANTSMWSEAVHHAAAAKDFDQAFAFVRRCAMSLISKGDLLTLLRWQSQLPAQLMDGQLEVGLALAWGMALVTRFDEANRLLTRVEEAAAQDPNSDLWWNCRAARAVLLGLADESDRAQSLALECLTNHRFDAFNFNALCNLVRYGHLKSGNRNAFHAVPAPTAGDDESSYVLAENYRLCLCGMAAVASLDFDRALMLYADARRLAERHAGARSVAAVMVTGLAARVTYERGDAAAAEIAVLDDFDLIETTAFHESLLQAFLVLIRATIARGDIQQAMSLVNRAERLSWGRGWGRVTAYFLLERIRILIAARRVEEARSIRESLDQLAVKYPLGSSRRSVSEVHICRDAAVGLLALASGAPDEAARHLSSAYASLVAGQDLATALRVGLELAIAHFRRGAAAESYAVLKEIMGWAVRPRAVSFILERRAEAGRILTAAVQDGAFDADREVHAFVTSLIAETGDREGPQSPAVSSPVHRQNLTDRERTIVRFIADGQSNKEIARGLGVAPETVKTHIKRIFQKLSAETRAQAVVRAQSLGLLRSDDAP